MPVKESKSKYIVVIRSDDAISLRNDVVYSAHHTLAGAQASADRHADGCASQGGYSQACIYERSPEPQADGEYTYTMPRADADEDGE